MTKLIRWLKSVSIWICRVPVAGYYWWAIIIVVASIVVTGLCGWTEKAFRITGMFLQLGGVLTVVWGILKTRADFGQPTVISQFHSWFKTFPRFNPPSVGISLDATLGGDLFGDIHLVSTHGPAVDRSIEGRLTHLESVVMNVDLMQGKTHVAVLRAEEKAQQELDTKARQLAGQIADVSKKIETTATSGVHLSAVGVVLLFVGTVFGGAAPELGNWLAMTPTL